MPRDGPYQATSLYLPRSSARRSIQIWYLSRKKQAHDLSLGGYPYLIGAAPTPLDIAPANLAGSLALRAASDPHAQLTLTRATPAAAFRAAQRMYLSGQRVDMQALAAELEVSRATLYRWTGDREQLLSDVLWSLSNDIFEQAKADHPHHTGPKRLLAIFRQHVGALVRARPLHIFLHQETHAALRILTSEQGGVQPRTVQALADLYREEQHAGAFAPRACVDSLAYAVVRVTEGFIYNDAIVSLRPAEVERAASIVSLLLE